MGIDKAFKGSKWLGNNPDVFDIIRNKIDGIINNKESEKLLIIELLSIISFLFLVCRNPLIIKRFVIVKNDSAIPCKKSTLARVSW